MRINYRFYDNFTTDGVLYFKEIGINIKEGIDAFVVYEDDELFEKVKETFGSKWMDHVSIVDTEFTEKEREQSDYISITPSKMLGYLQPEDWDEEEGEDEPQYPFNIYPYYEGVYEVKNTSSNYGMLRGKQIGNLSLQGEPKWGKSSIGSTFYGLDTFFTTPETYKQVFEPLGIQFRPVLGYGNKESLKTVVQLVPQGIANSKLIIKTNQIKEVSEIKEWGLKKFLLNGKGFFPPFEKKTENFDFFVSQEYFGSGGVNEKAVFISQKLYTLLKNNKVKGLNYYPMER